MKAELTIELVREFFDCDYPKGILFWKERSMKYFSDGKIGKEAYARAWNKRFAGKEAFTTVNCAGYRHGTVFGKFLLCHRVIFAHYHGFWAKLIDHKDGNPLNNSIDNLILSDNLSNSKNNKLFSHNTSGVCGVTWDASRDQWKAQIKVNGKNKFLIRTEDFYVAKAVRKEAERKYGFSATHGRKG